MQPRLAIYLLERLLHEGSTSHEVADSIPCRSIQPRLRKKPRTGISDLRKTNVFACVQDHIEAIRTMYRKDWESSDLRTRQMAVALYFIDKLALRAGHEKDEEEADTVGCCTLKVRKLPCSLLAQREATF